MCRLVIYHLYWCFLCLHSNDQECYSYQNLVLITKNITVFRTLFSLPRMSQLPETHFNDQECHSYQNLVLIIKVSYQNLILMTKNVNSYQLLDCGCSSSVRLTIV